MKARDELVIKIFEEERKNKRIELIVLSEGFFEELKQDSLFSDFKKKTIYEIPYIVRDIKPKFKLRYEKSLIYY